MEWWIWAIIGVMFLGLEILTPGGFFTFFFGIGGLITSLIVGIGLIESIEFQTLLFLITSVVLIVLVRPKIVTKIKSSAPADSAADRYSLVGDIVVLTEKVAAGDTGRGEARGTSWKIKNTEKIDLAAGDKVVVTKVDGLTLDVSKQNQ